MENNASKRPDRSAGVIINPLDLMDYKPMRENKPNSFVLFENKDKTGRQPDFKGSFYDESGKQWDIAGWMNTSMKGTNYISGNVQEPYKKQATQSSQQYVPGEDRSEPPF